MPQYPSRFKYTQWTIQELLDLIASGRLELQPHYQRNAIWSATAQRRLIGTIKDGYPLPSLFVRSIKGGKYEMVDGQQRCRAISAYARGDLADDDRTVMQTSGSAKGTLALPEWRKAFESYPVQVAILEAAVSDPEVEKYYVLLNTAGVRLNNPELRKADFYATRFLALVQEACELSDFRELNLFTPKSVDRMNDVEYVSELFALLRNGFSDKKEKVEDLYKHDLDQQEADALLKRFIRVTREISALNQIVPIQHTRYKQKNDFYTLFAFLDRSSDLPMDAKRYAYSTLVILDPHISPSKEECEPLMNYALNCVSQSNSRAAREARDSLFRALFENHEPQLNPIQIQVGSYMSPDGAPLAVRLWGRTLLDNEHLKREA